MNCFLILIVATLVAGTPFDSRLETLKKFRKLGVGEKLSHHFVKRKIHLSNEQPEDVQTYQIPQKIDNFNGSDSRTFLWRYHENKRYYKPGGPIILVVGGEWRTTPEEISAGSLIAEMAEQFGAYVFYTEHRYYGYSLPFSLHTTENLKYLSVDQGIEDIVSFIRYTKANKVELKDAKIVLMGGSYTGGFVSWFRSVYPELTVGAWSSSGVIDPQPEYPLYRIISGEKYLKAGGQKCYDAFQSTFDTLEKWAEDGDVKSIEENFKLCKPLVLEKTVDIQALMNAVGAPLVDVNGIARLSEIKQICDYVLDTNLHENVLQGVSSVSEFFYGGCIYGEFNDALRKVGQIETTNPDIHNSRPFFYQMCNEFGWFWTSSDKDPFGGKVTVDFWAELCTAAFGQKYTPDTFEENTRRVRLRYGGLEKANFTNVYTSQGEYDPWRRIGLNEDLSPSSPTYIIKDAAHCFDIHNGDKDLPGVVQSQTNINQLIGKWLNESK